MWPVPERDCWLHPAAEVRSSQIAGEGLFARTPIPAGTVVSRIGGRLVRSRELHQLLTGTRDGHHGYVDTITVADDSHLVLPVGQSNGKGTTAVIRTCGGRAHTRLPPGATSRPVQNSPMTTQRAPARRSSPCRAIVAPLSVAALSAVRIGRGRNCSSDMATIGFLGCWLESASCLHAGDPRRVGVRVVARDEHRGRQRSDGAGGQGGRERGVERLDRCGAWGDTHSDCGATRGPRLTRSPCRR